MENNPISETLDSPLRFRHWLQSDSLSAQYDFFFIKTPDGLVEAPEIKSRRSGARHELERFAGKRMEDIEGVKFTVIFDPARQGEDQVKWNLPSSRVVEMHFARQDCAPMIQNIGGYVYWKTTGQPRHDDAGDFAPRDTPKKVHLKIAEQPETCSKYTPEGRLWAAVWVCLDANVAMKALVLGAFPEATRPAQ